MRPLSTNDPGPVISTSDSKVARGPGRASALACTPLAVTVVRRIWLLAEVLAASFPSAPSTGCALPLNCNAKTSSFMFGPPLAGHGGHGLLVGLRVMEHATRPRAWPRRCAP